MVTVVSLYLTGKSGVPYLLFALPCFERNEARIDAHRKESIVGIEFEKSDAWNASGWFRPVDQDQPNLRLMLEKFPLPQERLGTPLHRAKHARPKLAIAAIHNALPDLLIVKILDPANNEMTISLLAVPTFPQRQQIAHGCRDGHTFLIWKYVSFRLRINPHLRISPK